MRFDLKIVKSGEGLTALSVEAASNADAILRVESQGYTVLAVRPAHALPGIQLWRRAPFPLVLFSQELLALLAAGLTLVESIQTLTENENRPETRKILERIVRSLYEGQMLSTALEQFPDIFPALYVATIRASEKTGDIGEALVRYVAYQSQVDSVRKKIVNASIYPVLLIVVGGAVMLFLMGYVVPRFAGVYEGMGSELPWFSSLLLIWGKLLRDNAPAVAVGALVSVALLAYGWSQPGFKRWLDQRLWQLPAIGERMRIYQLARFYRTLGMLQSGGMPIVTALQMVSGMLQPVMRGQLQQAAKEIREGLSISHAMEANGFTTPVASRMLLVGEGTGQMGSMMERIAAFYEEEMARWVDWFTRLFEPILMIVIGVVIGAIVVLMYLPVFELAGSLK